MHPNVEVIAIAGSVGKTTTKDITASILEESFAVVKSKANFDPIFNLPQTALKIRHHRKFVAEMGIDAPGQMEKYLTLVHPKIGVMTELSLEHSDGDHLQSLEMAIREEWKLIEALPEDGLAILNGDNETIQRLAKQLKTPTLLYGFNEGNDVRIVSATHHLNKLAAQLTIELSGRVSGTFRAPLLGAHNALAMTAGILVGVESGMTVGEIQRGLTKVAPPPHRLTPTQAEWGLILDDTYNSSPKAVNAAIDTLLEIDPNGVVVLGDMLELGSFAEQAHYDIGEYAARSGVATLVVFGEWSASIAKGYRDNQPKGQLIEVASRHEVKHWLEQHKPQTVLLKASRGMKLNEVVESLKTTSLAH